MTIGITGGIGSGKSTVARELARRGFPVYDCDREAKRIIAENREVQQQITDLLGPDSFVHGRYNTAYVAKRVFADPSLLTQLNLIVHPAVRADIRQFAASHAAEAFVFIESAILFESGFERLCDRVVYVDAPEDIRLERTIDRDYRGEATPENIHKVRARMGAQIPHKTNDTIILNNDGTASVSALVDGLLAML